MSLPSVLVAIAHGLGLLALAAVIGGLGLERIVLPAGVEMEAARRLTRRWITGCLVLLVPVTVAELLIRTLAMSGVAAAAVVTALPEVLARTHFGVVWSARGAALGLAVALSIGRGTIARTLCAVCTLGVALATSLTGHAAEWGDLTVSVVADWTHAIAASAWTGGLIVLAFIVSRQGSSWPPAILSRVARRFSRLAGVCLLLVLSTGVYNAWAQLGAVSALWTSPYGRLLVIKLLVAAALVWFGAVNRWAIVPRLGPGHPVRGLGARLVRVSRLVILGRTRLPRAMVAPRFSAYLLREAVLVIVVFAVTAALGEATPGRHAQVGRKLTTHVSARDFRASLDVGRIASFNLPRGDEARGRAVFVNLQCFDCHAAPDKGLPSPRRQGPDLAGLGRAHPAYIVESILNPNAKVVDGPGYSGPSGRSTMPDYRDKLSVAELIDLVEYLRTFDRPAPRGK